MSWHHDTLTARQAEILRFIIEHIKLVGYPPTLRAIGSRFLMGSTNGVRDCLLALEKKGCIERAPLLSRSIRVTDEGRRMLKEAVRA